MFPYAYRGSVVVVVVVVVEDLSSLSISNYDGEVHEVLLASH